MAEHLTQAGIDLELPELPQAIEHVWAWFSELCGKEPVTFNELMAWSVLTRNKPTATEISMIKQIDRIWHVN